MSRINLILREWLRDSVAIYLCGVSALAGIICALPAHPLRALAMGEGFTLCLWIWHFDSREQRAAAIRTRAAAPDTGASREERQCVVQVPALW